MRNKIQYLKAVISNKVMSLGAKTEDGGHLVEVLGTIAIAIFLLVLFRGQLQNVFNNAMSSVATKLQGLFG